MKNHKTALAVIALAVAAFAQHCPAPPVFPGSPGLYLYDTATQTGVSGNSVGIGVYTFDGTVGDYSVAISTGIVLAGGGAPSLDLDLSEAFTTVSGDQLQVYFSYGPLGPTPAGSSYVLATYGPQVGGGGVTSSVGQSMTLFGNSTGLGGSLDTGNQPQPTINAVGVLNGNNYYITMEDVVSGTASATLNNTNGFGATSTDSHFSVTVPEPASVVAAALMLLPLGIGAARSLWKDRSA